MQNLGKQIKRDPSNVGLRTKVYEEKRIFKKLVRKKRSDYNDKVLEHMNFNRKNGKKFWKLLDKLNLNRDDKHFVSNIPMDKWTNHFSKVLKGAKEPNYPSDCSDIGPLDFEISTEEMNEAAGILKKGKAGNTISNEMLSCVLMTKPNIILYFLNAFLEGKIDDTNTSLLIPIHKKGPKTSTDCYRGISLICSLSKLYAAILNKRLLKFTTDNNLLSNTQLGFIPGNRTSDAHIIIHNLVKRYCHKEGKMLYSCFVDFKKAFDSIPRDRLFEKLKDFGKFFNSLKKMYSNDTCKLKVNGFLSDEIHPNQGVRQGCVLSPLLFNLFLADLPDLFKDDMNTPKIDETNKISCLLWADELILFSKTESRLNNMIVRLQ